MKITRELRDVIERQIDRKREKEIDQILRERNAMCDAVNHELRHSPEFLALLDAAYAWEDKVAAVIAKNDDIFRRRTSTFKHQTWYLADMLDSKYDFAPVEAKAPAVREKYADMTDTVMLRLAYEKDFDKAMEILKQYGIELE